MYKIKQTIAQLENLIEYYQQEDCSDMIKSQLIGIAQECIDYQKTLLK